MPYVHDNIDGIAVDNFVGGSGASETVGGTNARDLLVGGGGQDVVIGGAGADIMYGGGRSFYIPAGAGVSNGERYNHVSYYGDGLADRFVFNPGDTGVGAGNRDIVRGFEVGIDKIDLRGFGEDLHYSYSVVADKVLINIDADANGKVDHQITVVTSYLKEPASFGHDDILIL